MINKKNNFLAGIVAMLFVSMFYSCLNSEDFDEYYYDTANIKTFSLDTSSVCEDLDEYVFYIDNINNEIYNYDSLPYETDVRSLVPVLYASSSDGNATIGGEAYKTDSAYDFSNEVLFKNTSSTGAYSKTYSIKVLVHKANGANYEERTISDFPSTDSVSVVKNGDAIYAYYKLDGDVKCKYSIDNKIWNDLVLSGFEGKIESITLLNNKFYAVGTGGSLLSSNDGFAWTSSDLENPLVALYGCVQSDVKNADSIPAMFGLVSKDNELHFAQYKNEVWTIGDEMNDNFPYSMYSSTNGESITGYGYLYLGFGKDIDGDICKNIWNSHDGLKWYSVNNENDNSAVFSEGRLNSNMFFYENKLVCFGGLKADGSYSIGTYESSDRGESWYLSSNWSCNIARFGIEGAASYVEVVGDDDDDDDKEFLWLFGGKTGGANNDYFNKIVKLYPIRMLF